MTRAGSACTDRFTAPACVPTVTSRAPACLGAGSPQSGRRPFGTRSPPSRSRRRRAPGAPPPGTGRRSSRTPQPAGARVVGTTTVSTGAGVAVSCRPLTLPHSNVCFPPPSGRPPSSTLQFRCESAPRQAKRARDRRGQGGAPSPTACKSAGSRRRRRPPPPPRGCAGTARPGRRGRPASTPGAAAGSVCPSRRLGALAPTLRLSRRRFKAPPRRTHRQQPEAQDVGQHKPMKPVDTAAAVAPMLASQAHWPPLVHQSRHPRRSRSWVFGANFPIFS